MSIAAVIICRNEERMIRDCLASIRDWVDEIVVVDAQSTDGTEAICREFTDRVFVRAWDGFSAQRNFALAQATADWILVLDADEIVPPRLADEIRAATLRPDAASAYAMPRLSWFCGKFMRWGGNYPDRVLRLFRRGTAAYSDRYVHESLRTQGQVGVLEHALLHYTYPTLDFYFAKMRHYTLLSAQQMQRDGKRWGPGRMITSTLAAFLSRFIVKQGYRDGWQGYFYAALSAISVFCKYAWLWDLERHAAHEKARLASTASQASKPYRDIAG